jgi:hypothetical protein
MKEVFKGSPAPDGVISTTTFILGGCGVPILTGQEQLFFVNPFEGEAWQQVSNFAQQSQGMISLFDLQILLGDPPKVDKTLDELRALAKTY